MTGARALWLVVLLALLSVAGIVGMLLADSALADGALFLVAALPLAAGGLLYRSRVDAR